VEFVDPYTLFLLIKKVSITKAETADNQGKASLQDGRHRFSGLPPGKVSRVVGERCLDWIMFQPRVEDGDASPAHRPSSS